jgi:hypothetical protein
MAFKLRSGNSPMFKGIGEEKETPGQYNARVRAEYEAKLKAHSDSTDAYNQAVIIDDLYNEGQGIKNEATQTIFNTFPQESKNEEAVDRSVREAGDLRVQNTEIRNKDKGEKIINPDLIQDRDGYFRDKYGRYHQETEETQELLRQNYQKQEEKAKEAWRNRQKYVSEAKTAREIFVEGLKKGGEIVKEGKALEDELQEGEIHPTSKRKLVKRGDNTYSYTNTAEDVKPGPPPREPYEMIDRIKIKNIDMGEPTIPDVIEPSKRKYTTSADGKWKTNLETGEKTRVKTQKVKKFRRPGKRNVRNLVTGGTNKVQ